MPKQKIFNRKSLKDFRKDLRNNSTPAEAVLWTAIQNSQLGARKFRRQHSIGKFIVDFYCPAEKLAIELDGNVHHTISAETYDIERDEFINSLDIRVLRYENRNVFNNLEAVLDDIQNNFSK